MERKFDAFISYRHHPVDSEVAAAVQRQLEHFTIPRAVQKKTGKKRIDHIFRDKEELPVTSDLNDNIGLALANSSFLIVICSPRTNESIWVQKEIETFLKTHGREKVLTVLAEGEPGDVIPEILLSEEITVIDEEGRETKTTIPREPLSCDYRMGIRKAKSVELLRLAASILGCPFDDLKQRMHQYRMRRLTAVFSVILSAMLIFSGYVLWSSRKIQENYNLAQENYELAQKNYELSEKNYQLAQDNYEEAQANLREAQRKQSQQLSSYSTELLNSGNRTLALQLALAALPSEKEDKPFVAEAEYSLSKALYAYRSKTNPQPKVTLPYSTGATVLQDYNKYMVIGNSAVFVYDSETGRQLFSIPCATDTRTLIPSQETDRLLFKANSQLMCYSISAGDFIWGLTDDSVYLECNEDHTRFLTYRPDADCYTLSVYNFEDGQKVKEYSLSKDDKSLLYATHKVWIEDSVLSSLSYVDDGFKLMILDFDSMEVKALPVDNFYGDATLYVTPDREILLYTYTFDSDDPLFRNRQVNGTFSDGTNSLNSYLGEAKANYVKYGTDGSKKWSHTIAFSQTIGSPNVKLLVSAQESDVCDEDILIAYIANKYAIINNESGRIVLEGEIPGIYTGSYENTATGSSRFITDSGDMGVISYSNTSSDVTTSRYFPSGSYDKSFQTAGNNMYLTAVGSSDLIHYTFMEDDNYTTWEDTFNNLSYKKYRFGNRTVVYSYSLRFDLIDFDSEELVTSVDLNGAYPTLLGATKDGRFLYIAKDPTSDTPTCNILFAIDYATGELTKAANLSDYFISTAYLLEDDRVLYFSLSGWYVCDSTTGEVSEWTTELPKNFVTDSAGSKFFTLEQGALHMITGSEDILLQENMNTTQQIGDLATAFSASGKYFCLAVNETVYLYDCETKQLLQTLNAAAGNVMTLLFFDDDKYLYYVTEDCSLLIYDVATGQVKNKLNRIFNNTSRYYSLYVCYTKDGQIAVNYATDLYFLDGESYRIRQYSPQCFTYDAENDKIVQMITTSGNVFSFRSFKHYTVADLVEKANEILENVELSEEQKKVYGLE